MVRKALSEGYKNILFDTSLNLSIFGKSKLSTVICTNSLAADPCRFRMCNFEIQGGDTF
jgi:hypothetical protein